MTLSTLELSLVAPEIFVLAMACVVLMAAAFSQEKNQTLSYILSILTLIGAAWLSYRFVPAGREIIFSGMVVADQLGTVLKLFCYAVLAVVFLYSRNYLQQRNLLKGEYFVLALFGLLGIMVMIAANNLMTMYLGLELLSLSLYSLVAINRDSVLSTEAAMKYFVLGAIASGCLLYGMSMLYGATGTLDLTEIKVALAGADPLGLQFLLALAFLLVGIAFKFGAAPFHMWVPDVYQGALSSVTLYVGTIPKVAAFALFMRILAESLGDMYGSWRDMVMVLAILSLAIGNLVAIVQTNIKRMLAYSTISHVGFILMGFLAGGPVGYQAALFYTLAYVIMATGAFGMIILLSRKGFEAERLEDFKGLNQRSPWFALIMLIVLFSMAGVPPMLGFYAKIQVIMAVLDAGLAWLAVLAVVFTVIGAFYYLRIIKLMYFDAPEGSEPLQAEADVRLVLSANGLLVLFLGLFPGGLLELCASVLP
ncbi:MAG: NADH-quinone oxidoreductase subunit NuoN [Gammaproteobacteria bacterium]|nr:NADH-quinone oxidoreductase subunit NuoN [Gammaproteobacteria bacterium]